MGKSLFYMFLPRLPALLFIMLFTTYGQLAQDIPLDFWSEQEVFNAQSMPYLISQAGILISSLLFLFPGKTPDVIREQASLDWLRASLLLVLLSGYGLILEFAGFALATVLFLVAGFVVLGERRAHLIFLASIPLVLGFWLLMDALGIFLAPGDILRSFQGD